MKKFLILLLVSLLALVVIVAGILFTQTGNDLVKPYLKTELEKQIGLPVEVDTFKLRYDHTVLDIIIDKALKVDVYSDFKLLDQSFDGTYVIYANNFVYQKINLKEANINGEFYGVPDDLYVNGKGTSFEAPINYKLRVLKGDVQEIHIDLKEMPVADILTLAKQPALAKGKVDAHLVIPTLVKEKMHTQAHVTLNGITFNDALMKKLYKVTLPKSFSLAGNIDANLSDTHIVGKVDAKSNIANVTLENLKFNKNTKHVNSEYLIDIVNLKELSGLLRTKLDGMIVLQGDIEKTDTLKVTGFTDSLGGKINYKLLDKDFHSSIVAMPMQNMLKMFSFPAFVDSNTSGEIHYNLLSKKGHTKLSLADFKLAPNDVTKTLGKVMPMNPTDIVFGATSLEANVDGDEVVYSLMAKASEASISIGEGRINKEKDTHEAKIEFGFNKYAIAGSIGGSIRQPKVGFDTQGFMEDQILKNDFQDKVEKEVTRFLDRLF